MASFVLTDSTLLVGGYDLTGDTNQQQMVLATQERDSTTFGSGGARQYKAGLVDVDFTHAGFVNYSLGEPIWYPQIGASSTHVVTFAPTGADDGELAYTAQALTTTVQENGTVGDMFAYTASGSGSTTWVGGTIMHPDTARTTSGDGTGYQLGAVAATETLYGSLHVIAASGTSPTLDVIVESDDNGSFTSATTQLTFSQFSAVGAEWQSTAGPITDDYFRVSYTIGGSGPSFTFVVTLGYR